MQAWPENPLRRFAAIFLGVSLGWLAATQAFAQPARPATDGVAPASARVSARELARQLAESIDAGDAYPTSGGPRSLRRLPGAMAIKFSKVNGAAEKLVAPGQALANYTVAARAVGGFTLFEGSGDEKRRQLRQPDQYRQALKQARSIGTTRIANPIFVDPQTGLRLLASEQIILCLKDGVDPTNYFGSLMKRVRPIWGAPNQFVLTLPGTMAEEVFAEVTRRAQHSAVAWAEPDFLGQAVKCSVPNDPYFAEWQWHLRNEGQGGGMPGADAKLATAWDLTTGNADILIAILDDGVQLNHPDLAANIFVNPGEISGNAIDDDHNGVVDDVSGFNFYDLNADPNPVDPDDNHGTAIAGVAAAVGNNGLGVAGAAYGCRLLPVKIIDGDYLALGSDVAAAFRYAAGLARNGTQAWRGADVLNVSLLFAPSSVLNAALTDAATFGRDGKGCSIFAAAGNGASAWVPYELFVDSPGTYTLRWEYSKDLSLSRGDDTVWIDSITYPDGTQESFENGGLPPGWVTGGQAPWSNVQQGVNGNRALTGWNGPASRSLRAGSIGNNQTTYVEVTKVLQPGLLRFWAWVSSERHADFFRFYVDGDEITGFEESGVPLVETEVGYPANHPVCFAVGASTDFDFRSDFSQYGVALDFLAPSDGGASTIFTTDRSGPAGYHGDGSPGGDYVQDFGGTSASTPLAAGIAALVLSANPHLYAGDIRALLRGTCDPIGGVTYGSSGRNLFYGSGRINAGRAVGEARPNLIVGMVASPAIAQLGSLTTYTVTVANGGAVWSGPFVLTNRLPAGAAFASSAPPPSNRVGDLLVFNDPGLEPGYQAAWRITVTNLSVGTNINVAIAASEALDRDPADNIASATAPVFPVPEVSITDALVEEGNKRATNALFQVSLSNPSANVVSVSYAAATTTAQSGTDFSARRGRLVFQPGETSKTISVRVIGDTRNEADETFTVNLTAPVGATLARAQAIGTIANDDPLPALSIRDVIVTEGNTGVRSAIFKVLLSAPSGRAVAVNYATASASAQAGTDFLATNGILTFPSGKISQKITVKVVGDLLPEGDLTFLVNLTDAVNAVIADGEGQGTILNNDKPTALDRSLVNQMPRPPFLELFQVRRPRLLDGGE
jgi:uncharacterized repeat protein (TIGR01451 family)